jgi:hypothetical protein
MPSSASLLFNCLFKCWRGVVQDVVQAACRSLQPEQLQSSSAAAAAAAGGDDDAAAAPGLTLGTADLQALSDWSMLLSAGLPRARTDDAMHPQKMLLHDTSATLGEPKNRLQRFRSSQHFIPEPSWRVFVLLLLVPYSYSLGRKLTALVGILVPMKEPYGCGGAGCSLSAASWSSLLEQAGLLAGGPCSNYLSVSKSNHV